MPDQTNLVQAIYSAVFNGVGSSGTSTANSYLSLEWPGMPVSDAEYGNPWSPSNTGGSSANTESFSALVDAIPNDSPVYTPSGLGVESVYALMLAATVNGASGPIAQAFAEAQEKFAVSAIGSAVDPSSSFHPSYAQPAAWASPAPAGWTSISLSLSSAAAVPPPSPPVLAAINKAITTQAGATGWRSAHVNLDTMRRITLPMRTGAPRGRLPELLAAAPVDVANVRNSLSTPAAAAKVAPSAAQTAASQAVLNRTLQARSVNQLLARPIAKHAAPPPAVLDRLDQNPIGIMRPHPELPPVAGLAAQPVQSKPITSSSLQLTMSCQRVNILREWLNPLLLHLGGWSISGVPAGSISSGKSDGNPGYFPLLPISFMVIRDVKITGAWSADDKTYAAQAASAGSVVAFGPLTLSNAAFPQSTFDGSTLTVPGMQILAWISTPTPLLPPT